MGDGLEGVDRREHGVEGPDGWVDSDFVLRSGLGWTSCGCECIEMSAAVHRIS
jgi:hypothetical protein